MLPQRSVHAATAQPAEELFVEVHAQRRDAPVGVALLVAEPLYHVDALGIVWHGRYYEYLEHARIRLLRARRLDASDLLELGFGMLLIESRCRHIAPLRYGDRIRVAAWLRDTKHRLHVEYAARTRGARSSGDRHSLEIAKAPAFAILPAVVPAADLGDVALRLAVREAYTRIGRLLRERALSRFRELRRYVVRHCDVDAITRAFTGRFPGLERLEIAMADLCRDELLLEAEGVAALDAPALAP